MTCCPDLGDGEDGPDLKELLMPESTTPETEYLRNLFWEQLFIALDELPEEQKQVFGMAGTGRYPFPADCRTYR